MLINIKYATKPKEVTSRVAEISEIFGIGINEDKCTQCPKCGRWHVKEDNCYFCDKEE